MKESSQRSSRDETVLERVNRTGVIRCGYVLWPPYLTLDLSTGQKSGIAFDFMAALADEMGLRVEWVEETGWGNFQEGLNTHRYDMMCSPVWVSGLRARSALLVAPIYENGLYAFARADDDRFQAGFDAANKSDIKIAVVEGDPSQAVRRARFPDAQEIALSPSVDSGQLMLNVTGRKADIIFDNLSAVERFNRGSTMKLHAIAKQTPVRMFSNAFAVKLGETEFKEALDSSIAALFKGGVAVRIIQKYPSVQYPTFP